EVEYDPYLPEKFRMEYQSRKQSNLYKPTEYEKDDARWMPMENIINAWNGYYDDLNIRKSFGLSLPIISRVFYSKIIGRQRHQHVPRKKWMMKSKDKDPH